MNIIQELQHLSTLEITSFLSRQLRLYGDDAKIEHVIKPLKEHATKILSTAHAGDPSPSQKSAAFLLAYCDVAIQNTSVDARLQELIVGAWVGLELDAVEKGENAVRNPIIASKFSRGTGRSVTKEAVAQFVKDKLNRNKFESVVLDAAENFATSESTITRRIRAARKAGLLS